MARLIVVLLLVAACDSSPTAPEPPETELRVLRYPIPSVGEFTQTFDEDCTLVSVTLRHTGTELTVRCPVDG